MKTFINQKENFVKNIRKREEDESFHRASTPSVEELEIIPGERINYGDVLNDLKEITSRASRALEMTGQRGKNASQHYPCRDTKPPIRSNFRRKSEYEELRRKYGTFK